MKVLKHYYNIHEAYADKAFLESEGIPVELFDEFKCASRHNRGGRSYLGVPDTFYEQSLDIIPSLRSYGIRCTGCGSGSVNFDRHKSHRKNKKKVNFMLVPFLLVAGLLGKDPQTFYCKDCGLEFLP